jgi:hypothetical protein
VATIAPGGSTVAFPTQFHAAPFVQGTALGGSALTVEVTSVTATNCVVNVFDNTNTSVGGTVNLSATGV